jgi:hypothetical protein
MRDRLRGRLGLVGRVTQARRTTGQRLVYHPIRTREQLARHLQWALSVELSTIPPYLCALYSIQDRSTAAGDVMRDVVIEEMLHMSLVSNLMNAIGARPSLAAEYVPLYPGYMPHHAAGGPFIQLQPLSAALARSVFMAIEQPESTPKAPAEGDRFATIGQFYKAIEDGFERCSSEDPALFARDTGFQRADIYVGAGGGELVVVHDLAGAKRALTEITEQGEGAPLARPPLPGEEPFGAYDHYGMRPDGTYGPIVGTPWELSHYRRFEQLATGEVDIPTTYPMAPNPRAADLAAPVRDLSELFDACYTLVLLALERTFTSADTDGAFFGQAFPIMQTALPALATVLVQTPVNLSADPGLGPNTGPAFVHRPRSPEQIADSARALVGHAPDLGSAYSDAWDDALDSTIAAVTENSIGAVTTLRRGKPRS